VIADLFPAGVPEFRLYHGCLDEESAALRQLPLETWVPGDRHSWFRIFPAAVTGRRLVPA